MAAWSQGVEHARAIAGAWLSLVVRVWVWSLRLTVLDETSALAGAGPRVFAFWHGRQLPLLALARPRPTAVMVSLSRDGQLQAGLLGALGFHVVRGSSSRRATRAQVSVIRALRNGADAAVAADGPRGPLHVAKPGALHAAQATGAALLPVGCAVGRAHTLGRTWDEFLLPMPFARAVVVIGAPLPRCCARELGHAIDAAQDRAARALASTHHDVAG